LDTFFPNVEISTNLVTLLEIISLAFSAIHPCVINTVSQKSYLQPAEKNNNKHKNAVAKRSGKKRGGKKLLTLFSNGTKKNLPKLTKQILQASTAIQKSQAAQTKQNTWVPMALVH
jgi:hypothetical protein